MLPLGETFTALRVASKNAGPQVSGYAASVPSDKVSERLTPQGRLLHLQRSVAPDSESLSVVVLEKETGLELRRFALTRLADYTLDVDSGVVTFNQALEPLDANLNDVRVDATYRLNNPKAQRKLSYGVQVWQLAQNYSLGAALVNLDGVTTYGVRGTYTDLQTRATVLAAYSSGLQLSADAERRFSQDSALSAQLRYQQSGYAGLAPLSAGLNIAATYKARLTPRLTGLISGEYHAAPAAATDAATATSKNGGSVTARADYNLKPFSVGGGAKYAFGDVYGLGAVASVGYHQAPLTWTWCIPSR